MLVQPARRLVSWPGGGSLELEPRVMKVLVALSDAHGEVLSRDRLIELCWDGRIVGDDALNRCIHVLRRLSREIEPAPFTIETVARVGYCLAGASPVPLAPAAMRGGPVPDLPGREATKVGAPPGLPGPQKRAGRALAGTLAVVLLAGAALLGLRGLSSETQAPRSISIQPEDKGSADLARDLTVDLGRLAGAHSDEMSLVAAAGEADLVAAVSMSMAGDLARANLTLKRGSARDLLWSGMVELPAGQPENLRPRLAGKLGSALACALALPREAGGIDATAEKLFVTACEQAEAAPTEQQRNQLLQVTRRAPDFAPAWGLLSLVEADLLAMRGLAGPPGRVVPQSPETIREHIARARKLDEGQGDSYAAEAALLPAGRWAEKIAILDRGKALDPENPRLHERLSTALFDVGRTTESVNAAIRAAELRPLSSRSRSVVISSLAHAGNLERARRELTEAERLWPEAEDLRSTRFSLELRYGDPKVAQRMIEEGDASLGGPTGGFGGPQILMAARLDPSPRNVARMVDFVSRQARRAPAAVPLRIQALGHANAVAEAYGMMEQPGVIQALVPATAVLFRPHLKGFRYDPRFMQLSKRLGLLHYWQVNDAWPDFCADPALPYDCRAEAKRLAA